jgi:hypothetical protein
VEAGMDARGMGLMISSSRGIAFAADPATAAKVLRDEIRVAVESTLASREVVLGR